MRIKLQHDFRGGLTHPKFGSFHLCRSHTEDKVVGTARDVVS